MDRLTQPLVLGVGEVLWDVYPDAEHFGGAPANVALHAVALGAAGALVSAVGRDARGAAALARLDAAGVDRAAVASIAEHPTGAVSVTLDASGQPTYAFTPGSARDCIPWSAAVAAVSARADAVCFGSIAQRRDVSRATIQRAVAAAQTARWRLFDVNLRQSFHDADVLTASLRLANAVKLNEEELPIVARICGAEGNAPAGQLASLRARFDLALAVLTRGPEGALIVTETACEEVAGAPISVVDTVGAGDAFAAAMLVGLLQGRPLMETAVHANRVAAYVCSQPGATPPIPRELQWH